MRTRATNAIDELAVTTNWCEAGGSAVLPGYLHLVSGHELQNLREALAKGSLPPDFEMKLSALSLGSLSHRFIEQNCRTIAALLDAARDGAFKVATPGERERLLRVLAYVRKDDDVIPDYTSDGFSDDQQEVRRVITELGPLLQVFKSWRLRHQVPGMWAPTRLRLN